MNQRRASGGGMAIAAALALAPSAAAFLAARQRPAHSIELTVGIIAMVMAFEIAAIALMQTLPGIRRDSDLSPGAVLRDSALGGLPLFFAWVILYFGTALVSAILFPAFPSVRPFALVPAAPGAMILSLTLVHALFEEILVGAYAVRALASEGAAISVGVSTILRFVCHLYQGPLAAVSVIPVGLLFASVYWRSRKIGPLLVAHCLGSILVFALAGARSI